ncbi:MAG: DUF1501 domain-containing protein [Verrucomicrobiaceae bacterium]
MIDSSNRTRRKFLGEASCGAIGSVSALSSLMNLTVTQALAEEQGEAAGDYRALVCVFLAGGNDSFNMLTPNSGDGYAEYQAARGGLALPAESLLDLSYAVPDGRDLGLAGQMPALKDLFTGGKASFVANVGTLVEPTSLAGIQAGSVELPLGLYSHFDQQLHWQSGLPDTRGPDSGWGGRMSSLLNDLNGSSKVSMNLSLSGVNMFQSGSPNGIFTKKVGSTPGLVSWNSAWYAGMRQKVESILEAEYANVFERVLADKTVNAIETGEEYRLALEACPAPDWGFTETNGLSVKLREVAESILARGELGMRRQTFFVTVGGWDHHGSLDPHPAMLGELSQAVGEFYGALEQMGVENDVTLFSASDFGRTLSSNGGGTDHGWGGNQFVVGGAVDGGKVFGTYPHLASGSQFDVGRGRLIPTTPVDEYFADLALWMGVSVSDLNQVLPNLGRFHDVASNGAPLGLMKNEVL